MVRKFAYQNAFTLLLLSFGFIVLLSGMLFRLLIP